MGINWRFYKLTQTCIYCIYHSNQERGLYSRNVSPTLWFHGLSTARLELRRRTGYSLSASIALQCNKTEIYYNRTTWRLKTGLKINNLPARGKDNKLGFEITGASSVLDKMRLDFLLSQLHHVYFKLEWTSRKARCDWKEYGIQFRILQGIWHSFAHLRQFDFLSDVTVFRVDICERNRSFSIVLFERHVKVREFVACVIVLWYCPFLC